MAKKHESLVTKVKLSDVIKTDATVDMNSIVAFFISKYETSLLDNKKQLSEQISKKNTYLNNEFIAEVEKEVNLPSFVITVPILGLVTQAELHVDANKFEKGIATIYIHSDSKKSENCNFNMYKSVELSSTLHKKYTDTINEMDALRVSLRETLDLLSSISRKERELRGALAEKTLRAAGVNDLFDDATLLNLVNLPQLSVKTVK